MKIGDSVKYNNEIWEIIDINNLNPKEIYYRLSNCPWRLRRYAFICGSPPCGKCEAIWVMDNYIKKL
jgi:hypothetical protein